MTRTDTPAASVACGGCLAVECCTQLLAICPCMPATLGLYACRPPALPPPPLQALQKLGRATPRLVVAADKATPDLVKQLQALSKANEDLAVVLATEQVPPSARCCNFGSRKQAASFSARFAGSGMMHLLAPGALHAPPAPEQPRHCPIPSSICPRFVRSMQDRARASASTACTAACKLARQSQLINTPLASLGLQRTLDSYGLTLDCKCQQELLIDDPQVN